MPSATPSVASPSGAPSAQPSATPSYPAMMTPLGFDSYDTDLNGKLNQAEYLAFMAARSAAAGEQFSRTGALYVFQARDIDADGSLDFQEFLTTDGTPAPSAPAATASGSQPNKDSLSVNVIVAVVVTTAALLTIIAAVCTRKKQPKAVVEANPVFAGTAVDPMTGMDMAVGMIASMGSRPPSVKSATDTASYASGGRQAAPLAAPMATVTAPQSAAPAPSTSTPDYASMGRLALLKECRSKGLDTSAISKDKDALVALLRGGGGGGGSSPPAATAGDDDAFATMGRMGLIKHLRVKDVDYTGATNVEELRELCRANP